MAKLELASISLFSGALGLDLGLERAGFKTVVAVENNAFAVKTIETNRPDIHVINKDIEDVSTKEILKAAGLKVGDAAVVTAGPCCQAYSTAGQRASMADPRGVLFKQFLRVVREARPRFFVMENVRGILSAAIQHRPLNKRGPGFPSLKPAEKLGSAFAEILKELQKTGYYVVFAVMNSADYGVPQTRERVVIVGSRDGEPYEVPTPTHSKDGNSSNGWMTLAQALKGLKDSKPEYTKLPPSKSRFVKFVPEGGNWRDLPKRLREEALGAAFHSWGGRCGFFRRLAWNRPAPSLTTKPDSKATLICHPTKVRPLTVREYARIQQFPDDWQFSGGIPQKYKQIGNAVPIGLGKAIGLALRKAMRARTRVSEKTVVCADEELLERLKQRPTTILNPRRMRKIDGIEAAKEWLDGSSSGRGDLFDVKVMSDIRYVKKAKRKAAAKTTQRRA